MKLRLALLLLSVSQIVVVIGRTREPGNDDDNNKFNKRANLNGSKSEKIEPREFKPLEAGDDEIVVKLVQKQSSSGSRSMIDFKFETRPFPQFSLRYKKSEQETGTALFAARVGLLRLVELAPGNQLNESAKMLSLRSRRESGRSKWSSLKDGLSTQTINGVEVRSVSTSLKFNNHAEFGNLSITLQFSFASDSLNTTDGVKLTPSSVKYSVIIKDWPFVNALNNLTLVEAVWLKSLKINMSKDNNSMALDQGLGFFSWQPTVSVDGTDRPLAVSEVMTDRFNFADGGDSDDDMGNAPRLVAFTMPSGQNIYWDPQLGASDTQITDQFGPASDALSAPKVSGLVLLFTMMFSMFFLF